MNYSKGISWFDDCRIPFVEADNNINFDRPRLREKKDWVYDLGTKWEDPDVKEYNTQGRFPANLLCSDDMLNDGIKPNKGHRSKTKTTGFGDFGNGKSEYHGIGDYMEVDSKSRYYDIDAWFNNLINNI